MAVVINNLNEGRRKKEEGGLYMWTWTPTQNGRPRLGRGINKNSEDKT
ncbi:MAG: hypothetical protein KME60_27340 [Cyanomargarita calcarea GSE-NOS-MK-12-04C]|uniref:Uncharacterized protein n=1 Tax=Cyanomargarita calcarea GSE-NOS-MK-12-04C TaxID=2839659 RepID=A0A951QUI6_9CYAN|nr:hypothetical protein [Cyanomargarita calcarea GSE-NOS-MK-12-04C]